MFVTTMMPPVGDGFSRVHLTVISTDFARASVAGEHVSANVRFAGLDSLVMFQEYPAPCVALMSLCSSCGRISFTGIEFVFCPMPAVVRAWLRRKACRDEPGQKCAPRARRW